MTDDKTPAPKAPAAQTTPAPAKPGGKIGSKSVWIGTAVGVGSAAIAAALLYAKRKP